MDPLKTSALPRKDIAEFIKSDRGVRSYEDLQGDTTNVYEAISTASFLTITGSPSLGSERTLTLSGDLSSTDGGPNALYTLGLSNTTVVPGTYGSASKAVSFTVSAKGRLTAATEYALNTDNVAEGATNLYYTDARARAALSSSTGISYNSGTGAIAVSSKLALYDGGDTPSAFTLGIVDSVDAAAWRTAIGAGTSSTTGTVTSVAALTLGTTGTDLGSSVANGTTTPVITLNVPTASASNRGALSSADWSTFNGKQASLVSGTNIKSLGGNTLLGSGDFTSFANAMTFAATTVYSGAPGSTFTHDVSGAAVSKVNGATVDFSAFSGMILVSDHTGGAVGMYICGGGTVTALGTTGVMGGTVTYNAGVNGYTFTNTSGGTRTFAFVSIRTRPAA